MAGPSWTSHQEAEPSESEASHQHTVSWELAAPRKKKKRKVYKSSHTQRVSFTSAPDPVTTQKRPYWGTQHANGSLLLREAQAGETRIGVWHVDARLDISRPDSKEAILDRGLVV